MIVIPDLFGAYQKGKEQAIQSNWQDLKNYEAIEAARTANDRANLQLLGELADFDIQRQVAQHLGNASARADKLGEKQFVVDTNNVNSNIYTSGAKLGVIRGASEDGRLHTTFDDQLSTSAYNASANKDIAHNSATFARVQNGVLHDPSNLPLLIDTENKVFVANQEVRGTNADYAPKLAKATNEQAISAAEAGHATNKNAKLHAEAQTPYISQIGEWAAKTTLKQFEATNKQLDDIINKLDELPEKEREALKSNLYLEIAKIDAVLGDPSRKDEHAAMQALREQYEAKLAKLGGSKSIGKGPAPVSETSTSTGGTSSGATSSSGSSTPTTTQGGSRQAPTATTPTVTPTALIPVATGTPAVVTNTPLGGHNYVQPVSNAQTFRNSQAGQLIDNYIVQPVKNAFDGYPTNGGGVAGLGVQQAIPRK